MSPNTDDLKGRAKEAVGDMTDDDRLKREGKADRASGKAKEMVDDLKDKAEDAIDSMKEKLHRSRAKTEAPVGSVRRCASALSFFPSIRGQARATPGGARRSSASITRGRTTTSHGDRCATARGSARYRR